MITTNVCLAPYSHIQERVLPLAVYNDMVHLGVSRLVSLLQKDAACNKVIFLAHANAPFAVVCDVADCLLTHHSYTVQLLH